MMQRIGEKISVIARFRGAGFEPSMFKWEGRPHKVKSVNGRWAEHDGQFNIYHFAVVSDTDVFYEISFHTREMAWVLDKFMIDEP
ncbi:MAG TPA: hypothetical protein PLQ76_07445 [bacterium]|nr:hypothetical protein [bacterium]